MQASAFLEASSCTLYKDYTCGIRSRVRRRTNGINTSDLVGTVTGQRYIGTVTGQRYMGVCNVSWDDGTTGFYYVGHLSRYDLCDASGVVKRWTNRTKSRSASTQTAQTGSCRPYADLECGSARVVRGPDWIWGDQDGRGDGDTSESVGTVVGKSWLIYETCVVVWDKTPEERKAYRVGMDSAYDLCEYSQGASGPDAFSIALAIFCILSDFIVSCRATFHPRYAIIRSLMAKTFFIPFVIISGFTVWKLLPPAPPAYTVFCETPNCIKISHNAVLTAVCFVFEVFQIIFFAVYRGTLEPDSGLFNLFITKMKIIGAIVWVIYSAVTSGFTGPGTLVVVVLCVLLELFLILIDYAFMRTMSTQEGRDMIRKTALQNMARRAEQYVQ
jgi:hypothetical protein